MEHKTIEVTIHPDGGLHIEALGFTGADCEKATAFIEDSLGQAKGRVKKPEYYQRSRSHGTRRQKLGGGS